MKRQIIILIVILFQNSLFGQKWENIYGNPGTDESFSDIIELYDHGYLIASFYESNDGCWLIKTDLNGNMIWEKFLTWPDVNIFGGFLDQDDNGNIYIATVVAGGPSGYWPMITKLDSCGEKVWCRVFPNYAYDYGWYDDVFILENDDILALARFISTENNDRVYLDYIDSEGNLIWRQLYAAQENHPHIRSCSGDGIKKYGDNYIIHGHCYYPYPTDTTHFYQRPLFIMLDSLFNEQWIIPFGVSDSIIGKALETIQLSDSIFMGVGMLRLYGTIEHSLLMYFDKDGQELGYREIPNDSIGSDISQNYIMDIERINDSLFIGLTSLGIDDSEFFIGELVIDSSGKIFKKEYRPAGTSGGGKLIKSFDNKYVAGCGYNVSKTDWDIYMYKINEDLEHDTAYSGNYTYDSLCPYQIQSGNIDISDCLIVTDVGEIPSPQEYYTSLQSILIKAYPNPVKENQITFEFQNTEHHRDMELMCFIVGQTKFIVQ
jgi:hypothetical protein